MAKELTKSERRQKFGHASGPIPATRVLQRKLEHFQDQGIDGKALLIINDQAGTFTAANVYDGTLGKNYDPEGMTHSLPAADSDKWKEWRKRGYEAGKVEDFDVLILVKVETPAKAAAAAK